MSVQTVSPQNLKSRMLLTASTTFTTFVKDTKPYIALLPDTSEEGEEGRGAAITIRGDNLLIDFKGLVLRGTPERTEPNARQGTGILVQGKNITLKNLSVHGYKIGIFAKDCPNLTIIQSDFSYNWKQKLKSTLDKEDLDDWMSFHQNEKDEWLRYGAGIYLRNCQKFAVREVTIKGGQCGLMLTQCDRGEVIGNDFSFLSAIGLGLYRSSQNRIFQNKIDWCVRGYSHGVYNRGQDSAGILVYEQSSHNIFAYNSVTHGGDGFFLWAGQTTMDTGKGGCDDNLLYGNDFSHAPTNGIEATFSRNTFANNLILECWHGVWGGYSYKTKILGNTFGQNTEAIAIEHGRDNVIEGNQFHQDTLGIRLWRNAKQDPSWKYVKFHETTSRDYKITHNSFGGVATPLRIEGTSPVIEQENTSAIKILKIVEVIEGWKPTASVAGITPPVPIKAIPMPFLARRARRGRATILVDEWGPYDFNAPRLWPLEREPRLENGHLVRRFAVLGPRGRWKLKPTQKTQGVTLLEKSGEVPGEVLVRYEAETSSSQTDIAFDLVYSGVQTIDYRGIITPEKTPITFSWQEFFVPIAWQVAFFTWEKETSDPRTQESAFQKRLTLPPLAQVTLSRLDYAGYRFHPNVPANYFATVAEGDFQIAGGEYILEITTDDGCRVWLDGKLILSDAWKYQGPTLYPLKVKLGGKHHIKIQHFQIDGYATLRAEIKRG